MFAVIAHYHFDGLFMLSIGLIHWQTFLSFSFSCLPGYNGDFGHSHCDNHIPLQIMSLY